MKFNFKELIKGILIICTYFVLQIILSIPFVFLLEDKKISINTAYLFIYLGLSIVYTMIYRKSIKENIKDLKKNYKTIIKTTLKYWSLGLVIMILSSFIIGLFNIPTSDNQNTNIELFKQAPILQSLCAIIFAPIIEELVFRHSFRKFTNNPTIFALTTGLIFGFVHITSSITSLKDLTMMIHLIPYSAVGIAFGYAYKKNNNNIIGTILIHSIHNMIAVIEILILL